MFTTIERRRVKGFLGTVLWPVHTKFAVQLLIRDSRGLVLTFHYIGTPILPGIAEDLFISLAEFRRILDFINGYLSPLPPLEFLSRLREGTLPKRATMITFDDCPNQTVAAAFPELARRNLSACFFVNPGLIAAGRTVPCIELMCLCAAAPRGDHRLDLDPPVDIEISNETTRSEAYRKLWPVVLRCPSSGHPALFRRIREALRVEMQSNEESELANWDVLKSLDAAGMLVGNHTMFHSTIASDGVDRFRADVGQAYEVIEQHLGTKARIFCYPYGRTDDEADGAPLVLRDLQTEYAFVTQGGAADARRSGCLALHREDASYSAEATKLAPLLACLR